MKLAVLGERLALGWGVLHLPTDQGRIRLRESVERSGVVGEPAIQQR